MLHAMAGAVKGAMEQVMSMDGRIDEEGESLSLSTSFLKNGTGHHFLDIKIFIEYFSEARSISHGI